MAKRKALFDDKPVEISVSATFLSLSRRRTSKISPKTQELTFIIKQDLANINKQILSLQNFVKQRKQNAAKSAETNQIHEHNNNVVVLLQNRLASTSITFKDVLEVRTQVHLLFISNNYSG